ncbi:MAG: DUF1934 domain-containing protein [Clostridia bacterium]|nr:DUF1934 domain-containing protein [Clostridia bacterium]
MDYLIKVLSLNDVDGDETKQEIITHASLTGDKDDYTIVYAEDIEGLPAKTTIRVLGGECVTVNREAEMKTNMVIEVGIKHMSEHKLPFGYFQLEVIGKSISSVFNQNETELSFAYATYQDNMPVGKAEFHITLRKKRHISGKV